MSLNWQWKNKGNAEVVVVDNNKIEMVISQSVGNKIRSYNDVLGPYFLLLLLLLCFQIYFAPVLGVFPTFSTFV